MICTKDARKKYNMQKSNAKLAAEALGIKKPTVEWRARNNKFGFSLQP